MKIVYVATTAWKIIYVLIRKDKHVSHDVEKYIILSLICATKELERTF